MKAPAPNATFMVPLPYDTNYMVPGPGSKDEIDDRMSAPSTGISLEAAQGTLPAVPGLPAFTAAPPNKWPSCAPGL